MNTHSIASSKKIQEEAKEIKNKVVSAAQREIHKHSVGIGLGQTFLLGEFEDKGDNKITTDFFYSYTASYSFDLLVNYHSSQHEFKNKEVRLNGLAVSIKARSYEFDAFSPFVLGGLGFYQPQVCEENQCSDLKSTFGFNLGTGVDLRLNQKVIIGLAAQLHKPFEVKQDDVDNVRGTYLKLLLTGMYLF